MSKTFKIFFTLLIVLMFLVLMLLIGFMPYGQEGKLVINKPVNVYDNYPSGGSPLQYQGDLSLAIVDDGKYCRLYHEQYQESCSLEEVDNMLPIKIWLEKIRERVFYLVFRPSIVFIEYKNDEEGITTSSINNVNGLAKLIKNETPETISTNKKLQAEILMMIRNFAIQDCNIMASLDKGEVVGVIGIRYGEDRMYYKVRLKDGRKGFIMHDGYKVRQLIPCTLRPSILFC